MFFNDKASQLLELWFGGQLLFRIYALQSKADEKEASKLKTNNATEAKNPKFVVDLNQKVKQLKAEEKRKN